MSKKAAKPLKKRSKKDQDKLDYAIDAMYRALTLLEEADLKFYVACSEVPMGDDGAIQKTLDEAHSLLTGRLEDLEDLDCPAE